MSSSPQMSKQDNQSRTSQGKLNSFVYNAVKLQEETIFEKQTVRISPSLHKKDVPKTTYLTNEKLTLNTIDSCAQTDEISNVRVSFRENNHFIDAPSSRRKYMQVDKECQTENFLLESDPTRANMENGDCHENPTGCLYPEISRGKTRTNEYEKEHAKNKCSTTEHDTESKDRELEHIDVVSETKYESEKSTDCVDNATQPGNGLVNLNDINVYKEKEDTIKKSENALKDEEPEEEPSCCVNCLYITLNVCECVIL